MKKTLRNIYPLWNLQTFLRTCFFFSILIFFDCEIYIPKLDRRWVKNLMKGSQLFFFYLWQNSWQVDWGSGLRCWHYSDICPPCQNELSREAALKCAAANSKYQNKRTIQQSKVNISLQSQHTVKFTADWCLWNLLLLVFFQIWGQIYGWHWFTWYSCMVDREWADCGMFESSSD